LLNFSSKGNHKMANNKPVFDVQKARAAIEKGRRANWWLRKGTMKRGFNYVDSAGKKITKPADLERIKLLVVPPAWKYVRISPYPGTPVQVVGMDTTGRVQYLYNQKFAEKRQRQKFEKLERFGKFLPKLKQATNKDVRLEGFPKRKVLALMMGLINSLYFRVGTEKSARHYKTYGITTLQNKHLTIRPHGELIFDFVGKSHIKHRKVMVDAKLATAMKELKGLGHVRKLFNYVDDDGKVRPIKPGDINRYIKELTDPEFSAKDFRTWAGTLLAAAELAEIGKAEDEKTARSNIVRAVKKVAEELGNTPAVCRGSYIHPKVIKRYEAGITLDHFSPRKSRNVRRIVSKLDPEEAALLRMLKAS
jgi:DNA topoisomerase I